MTMTEPSPWLASACEQIALNAFDEMLGELDGDAAAGGRQRRTAAVGRIRRSIGDLIAELRGPEIVFQPILMLDTMTTIGFEALSRFPAGSSSEHWFRNARETGMSSDLELTALMRAVERLRELPADLVCLNASPPLLSDSRLHRVLERANTDRIVVEVTQPDAVPDCRRLLDGLDAVRSTGCRIAFDDVGTGFIGLEQVFDIQPEIIKLSPALTTAAAGPGGHDRARRLIDEARRSGTFVIAKHVETRDDLDVLHTIGVEAAQGFLLGEPRPAEAYAFA